MKKGVDKPEWKWYNMRALKWRAKKSRRILPKTRIFKKSWKNFKKVLDKAKEMWYNNKVARKEARRWSLKIEQQEMKYKAYWDMCKCERISTIQNENTTQQK